MKVKNFLLCVSVLAAAVVCAGCGGAGDGDGAPPGTTGDNLIVNGGFEDDFDGWINDGGRDVSFFVDTVIKATGGKSLKVIDCEWQSTIYQDIDVEPDTEYIFSVSCLVSRDDTEPWGVLIKINHRGFYDYTETPFFEIKAAGFGWKSYRESFNSGSNTKVCLIINGDQSEFYVDRVSLYKKSE
jgi:hypothetical protein